VSWLKSPRSSFYRHLADYQTVSEPVALELRQTTGDIYLHAQIFTGFMYVAAALCMCGLRGWKIGQIEQLALEQEERPEDIDAATTEALETQAASSALKSKGNVMRRMMMWKKV